MSDPRAHAPLLACAARPDRMRSRLPLPIVTLLLLAAACGDNGTAETEATTNPDTGGMTQSNPSHQVNRFHNGHRRWGEPARQLTLL